MIHFIHAGLNSYRTHNDAPHYITGRRADGTLYIEDTRPRKPMAKPTTGVVYEK